MHDTYQRQAGDIPLGVFCRQSLAEHLDADDIFEITKQGFEFFEDAFDMPYPFGKYDQLFVPEYNMGAMENAGCVTFRDEIIFRSQDRRSAYEGRANTILHEMAHMWFGDLVTMRWWDDLWLNESFAEWAAHHASTVADQVRQAWTKFCNARKTWAYRQDQLPSTHPIAADNYDLEAVEVNFDGITYAKGASALRQLVAWVGEDAVLRRAARLLQRARLRQHRAARPADAPWRRRSGRELGSWTKEWLQTSGVNTLRPDFSVGEDGTFTSFAIMQTALPEYPTMRRHRIAVGLYDLTGDGLVRTDARGDRRGRVTTPRSPSWSGSTQPDLVLLNDGDLTYTKVRLDERSLETVVESSDKFVRLARPRLCWGAAWDMTRDAEMRPATGSDLVLRGVGQGDRHDGSGSVAAPGQDGHRALRRPRPP